MSVIEQRVVEYMDMLGHDINDLPTIIGQGQMSMIFELSDENVVVLTLEKEKFSLLKCLNKDNKFLLKKVKENNFPYSEDLSYLFFDNSFDCFIMSKAQKFDLRDIESSFFTKTSVDNSAFIVSDTLSDFSCDQFEDINILSLTEIRRESTEIVKSIKNRFNSKLSNLLEEDLTVSIEEYTKFSNDILDSIQCSLSSLSGKYKGIIDIHNEQFLNINGEIICSDPVMFNYHEFI